MWKVHGEIQSGSKLENYWLTKPELRAKVLAFKTMNRLLMHLFRLLSKLTGKLNSWAHNKAIFYRIKTPRTEKEKEQFLKSLYNIES